MSGFSGAIRPINFEVVTLATHSSTVASIPLDDTIPQVGEGVELLNKAIVIASAASVIDYYAEIHGTVSSAAICQIAIFRDGGANALDCDLASLTGTATLRLRGRVAAGAAGSTTFSVRVGTNTGTLYINGNAGGRLMGGTLISKLHLWESAI